MDDHEAARFRAHPMAADAARLRRWDDAAKDPHGAVLSIDAVLVAYDRLTGAPAVGSSADE
jgi:predicted HD phosphohydrolase